MLLSLYFFTFCMVNSLICCCYKIVFKTYLEHRAANILTLQENAVLNATLFFFFFLSIKFEIHLNGELIGIVVDRGGRRTAEFLPLETGRSCSVYPNRVPLILPSLYGQVCCRKKKLERNLRVISRQISSFFLKNSPALRTT